MRPLARGRARRRSIRWASRWATAWATAASSPKQEMRAMWGIYSGGLTWRYYGKQRFVGGFGIDLEFSSRAFRSPPTPRWSRRRRITTTTRGMSIRSCCRSSGSPTSTCSATACASTSRRPRPSPTTSPRPTRTSMRATGAAEGLAGRLRLQAPARQPLGLRTGGRRRHRHADPAASSSTSGRVTTSVFRTSCATATSMRTTPTTAPKIPSGRRRCVRRSTTSPSPSA